MPKTHIEWSDDEISTLAELWVERRCKLPCESATAILNFVQSVLPEDRRRVITGLSCCPKLLRKIGELWRKKMETVAPAQETEPYFVTIDVPKPVSYPDLLKNLDLPSLMALLMAKMQNPLSQLSDQLREIAVQLGSKKLESPIVVPQIPLPLIPVTPRPPRVAIVGLLDGQFKQVQQDCISQDIKVDLRFVDKDKSNTHAPPSCDYCICTKFVSHSAWHSNSNFEDRLFFIDGGTTKVIQKLRDIAARQ